MRTRKVNARANRSWRVLVNHLILISGALFLTLPVLLMMASSTHSSATLAVDGLKLWPGAQAFNNYSRVGSLQAGFTDQITALAMLRNSFVIATGVAALTTLISLSAAYALVFFKLPVAAFLFWLTMATLLLPLESRFVTTFQVAASLGLVNTFAGMILPTLAVALGTLFFRQLFLSFPDELTEAARLDGAGPLRFFRDFAIPLCLNRGTAIFIVSFMTGWNQYLWPLILSTDESRYTVMRGLRLIGLESGPGMALAVMTLLPPLVLVILFQKAFRNMLLDWKAQQ